jgi:hypothetical protein
MPTRGIVLVLIGLLMAMAVLIVALLQFTHREPRGHGTTRAQTASTNVPAATAPASAAVPAPETPTQPAPAPAAVGPNPPEGAPLAAVTIDTPQENESVPRMFQVKGHCSQVPPGQHLLLVIQTGRVFSPKWPPIEVKGDSWTGRAMEYGVRAGGSFTLCVFEVNDAGLEEISRWDAEGVKSRRWPPFREIPGGTLLTSMKLRVADQQKP